MTPLQRADNDPSVAQAPLSPDRSTGQSTAQSVESPTVQRFDRGGEQAASAFTDTNAPTAQTEPPLVRFDNVRVDTNGRIVCADLAFEAYECPVAICGPGGEALVHGLVGDAFGKSRIMQGRMLVDGLDVGKKEHFSKVAIALANPKRPSALSVKGYLRMHGIASGLSRSKANDNARAALYDLGLRKLENMLVEVLSTEQLRCASLAAALVTTRPIVVAQTPVADLDAPQAKFVLSVLGQVARHANVIVTANRMDASSPEYHLVMGARHVVMTDHQTVLWQGAPRELLKLSQAVSLWVQGNLTTFGKMLSQQGFGLWPKGAVCGQNMQQPDQASAFVTVRLPKGKTTQHLLQIAHDCQIAVLQMLPLLPGSVEIQAENEQITEHPSQPVHFTQQAPANPSSPNTPTNQTSPVDPVAPVDPIAPVDPVAPVGPSSASVATPESGRETGMENGVTTDVPEPSTTLP